MSDRKTGRSASMLVFLRSGRGPFGFKPAELEHSLVLLLQDEFPELKPKDSAALREPDDKGRPAVAARPEPSATARAIRHP